MGEMFIVRNAKLDVCDYCQQQGGIEYGQYIKDNYGENMLFKCFNCLVKAGERK